MRPWLTGKLKREGETIRRALAAKQALVAEMLNVPREEFDTIADMASEPSVDKDAAELLLASINQVNQLTQIMNEALDVTEPEVMASAARVDCGARLPSVPAHKIQPITSSLIAYFTQLLIIMPEKEEEMERLRRELQQCREQLHAMHEKQDFTEPSCEVVVTVEDESGVAVASPCIPTVASPCIATPLLASPASDMPSTPEVFVDAVCDDSDCTMTASVLPSEVGEPD